MPNKSISSYIWISPNIISKTIFIKGKTKYYLRNIYFKGSGHYWWLLKIIIIIKPFLTTSNGERLIGNIKKSSSLWRSFRERSNFPRIWFRDLGFRSWGLEIKHLKAHNFVWPWCDKGVFFLSLMSRNFDDRLSSNFHRFVISCICWDTSTVKTGLWQLPIVSRVFNNTHQNSTSIIVIALLQHTNKITVLLPKFEGNNFSK